MYIYASFVLPLPDAFMPLGEFQIIICRENLSFEKETIIYKKKEMKKKNTCRVKQ